MRHEEWSRAKAEIDKKAAAVMLAWRGDVGHFCGLHHVLAFLSVFRHDYKVILFLSQTTTVSEWMTYETAHVQHKNIMA